MSEHILQNVGVFADSGTGVRLSDCDYSGLSNTRTILSTFDFCAGSRPKHFLDNTKWLADGRVKDSIAYMDMLISNYVTSDDYIWYHESIGTLSYNQKYFCVLQSGDVPIDVVRSVAFQSKVHFSKISMIPDVYFFERKGWHMLRLAIKRELRPWADRINKIFWRGSTTGVIESSVQSILELPRVRLCDLSLALGAPFDCKITQVLVGRHYEDVSLNEAILKDRGLLSVQVPQGLFMQYKFQVDIDGNANSWSFFNKLLMGSCVLKVTSPWTQWYYELLKPWVHYVPVATDLSDLAEKGEWCLSHDQEAFAIAKRGMSLAQSLSFGPEMFRAAERVSQSLFSY